MKLREMLTTRRALVVVVGLMLALAWAVPSVGAGVGKVARLALGRANQAVYNSKLAVNTSDTAKSTANSANATANSAKTTAAQAQSTANQALSIASGAVQVQDNFTRTFDPGDIAATSCSSEPFLRLGVLSSDEVIVTPPGTQPLGILVQAYTAAGQVTLVFCNVTNSAQPIDPPSGTYEFSILR